jgi:hypothetical protein
MRFAWQETVERLATWQPVRRLASAIALDRAFRHLVELDHADPARTQMRVLRGLVHRARNTTFGRSHDFARIRTHADYKRLVPLSTAADYLPEGFNRGSSLLASCPGPVLSWLQPPGSRFPVPVSSELLSTFDKAMATAIGHILTARPRERLLNGQTVVLNDDGTQPLQAAIKHWHPAWRSCVWAGMPVALSERPGQQMTCLVAGPAGILQMLNEARRQSGHLALRAIWPDLCAIVCIRSGSTAAADSLRRAVPDESILTLEAWCDNAGPVAIEDPRHNSLRLFTDHGVFWEFIPIESLSSEPERLTVGSIEVGGRYALAMSSPAGVWSYLLREQIVVENCAPVLIQVLENPPLLAPARKKQGQSARMSLRRPLALLKSES